MLSAVIRNGHSYRAMPLAGQLVHHRSAHPGPLVLGATPLNSPARTLDRDRLFVTRPAGFLFPLAPCVAAGVRPYLLASSESGVWPVRIPIACDRSFLLIVRTSRIFTAHRSSGGSTEFPAFSQICTRRCRALITNRRCERRVRSTAQSRTVSQRSEPSSRTALMGEQPNPWEVLPPQDATSRHRGAKRRRRCERLGVISLLSPG